MLRRRIRIALLVVAALLVLSIGLTIANPIAIIDRLGIGQPIAAKFAGIRKNYNLNRRTRMTAIYIRFPDNRVATAFALPRQLARCSNGYVLRVRKLNFSSNPETYYRVVSKSCAKPDW